MTDDPLNTQQPSNDAPPAEDAPKDPAAVSFNVWSAGADTIRQAHADVDAKKKLHEDAQAALSIAKANAEMAQTVLDNAAADIQAAETAYNDAIVAQHTLLAKHPAVTAAAAAV